MRSTVAAPACLPQPAQANADAYYLYLYAIVAAAPAGALPFQGLDPSQPVYRLGTGTVQAIVSLVPAQDFTVAAIKEGLQTMAWVEHYVRAHQGVLDQLVGSGQTILPLRFCTIYRDEATVLALLAARERELFAELLRLAGKAEWGVKLFVELGTLAQALRDGHPVLTKQGGHDEIATLRQRIAERTGGAAFLYKKKLEALIATSVDEYTFVLADESHACLAQQAVAALTNPLPQASHDLRLNAAYLVAQSSFADFHAAIEALGESYGALGVRYELSGPWPAYNFLNLTLDE